MALFAVMPLAPLRGEGVVSNDGVTSQVRADRRTGRLIRRVVVPENEVVPRVVEPIVPGSVPRPAPASTGSSDINTIVTDVSAEHGVDPLLVHAIIKAESGYNQYALSPKGAQGLMQLIPATAKHYGVSNVWDKRQNVEGGVRYLRHLMTQFNDMRLVLAAYNAGEGAVFQYRGIPPYEETQEYVYRVGRNYGELRRSRKPQLQQARAVKPAEPVHRPVETIVDSEGRIHLRTR